MLFRAEALHHAQQDQSEGHILVRSPGVLWGCAIVAAVSAAAIALLLFGARHSPQLEAAGRILPDGQAQLLVPARALAHIRPGQRLVLRYPALPAAGPGHHGTVRLISRIPEAGAAGPHRYRILITPDPRGVHEPLQAGMVVEATLALPEIRLIDSILRTRP